MKTSSDLFELIKSLSKSEKRYFKLFSSIHKGEKNYLKLFDSIDRQQEYYNEAIIRKEFSREKFIKHLPKEKNYLYQLILKSSESYHSNIDMEMKSNLNHIQFLFEKGLYKQCEKIIAKAKQLARKYEKHLPLLEVLNWELVLWGLQTFEGKKEKDIEKLFREMFDIKDTWKNAKEYQLLRSRIAINSFSEGQIREDAQLVAYKKIMNHRLLKVENKALSYLAKISFYNCKSSYFSIRGDFINTHSYAQKLVTLMEAHPHQIQENPQSYINALYNLIICQDDIKKYKEALLSIHKLKAINTQSENLKSQLFYLANTTELSIYANTGEFDKGLDLITQIADEISSKSDIKFLNRNLQLYYYIVIIYFSTRNYTAANIYLNKILNQKITDIRNDIQCFARILSLIVHYELGHDDLLEYIEKSAHRFLDKKNSLYKVETSILDFMRNKVPKIITPHDKIKAFKKLKIDMEQITKDPFEKKALEYFDFISWLESKIENKSFAEIVREKARQTLPAAN